MTNENEQENGLPPAPTAPAAPETPAPAAETSAEVKVDQAITEAVTDPNSATSQALKETAPPVKKVKKGPYIRKTPQPTEEQLLVALEHLKVLNDKGLPLTSQALKDSMNLPKRNDASNHLRTLKKQKRILRDKAGVFPAEYKLLPPTA